MLLFCILFQYNVYLWEGFAGVADSVKYVKNQRVQLSQHQRVSAVTL